MLHVCLEAMAAAIRPDEDKDACVARQVALFSGFPHVSAQDTERTQQGTDAPVTLHVGGEAPSPLEVPEEWRQRLRDEGPVFVDGLVVVHQAAELDLATKQAELRTRRDEWHRARLLGPDDERKESDTDTELQGGDEPSLELPPELLQRVHQSWWHLTLVLFDWVRHQTGPKAFLPRYQAQMQAYTRRHLGQKMMCLEHGGLHPSLPLRPRPDYYACLLCTHRPAPTREQVHAKQQIETDKVHADVLAQLAQLRM